MDYNLLRKTELYKFRNGGLISVMLWKKDLLWKLTEPLVKLYVFGPFAGIKLLGLYLDTFISGPEHCNMLSMLLNELTLHTE